MHSLGLRLDRGHHDSTARYVLHLTESDRLASEFVHNGGCGFRGASGRLKPQLAANPADDYRVRINERLAIRVEFSNVVIAVRTFFQAIAEPVDLRFADHGTPESQSTDR